MTAGPPPPPPSSGAGGAGLTTRSGTGGVAELYWEDLAPGRRFDLGVTVVDGAEMVAFAHRFDPQWYHVDQHLAARSEYGELIASGFFTVSLFMRAYVDGLLSRAAAAASPGLEEVRWLAPVRAGDRLEVAIEVVDQSRSRTKPECGTVTLLGTMSRLDDPPSPVDASPRAGSAPPDGLRTDVLRTRFRGWFLRRESVEPAAGPAEPAGG